ncbi:sensor histidine kinase [Ruminiclostridium cellobioparum]|uniref:sensor histidine kinase n=1 Tax=Ruminiclostridium cellobioparum TaxID=29355 RepID=UPI0028A83DC1|nr:histidine kinase [Ruminiclostridium cellobioparum]
MKILKRLCHFFNNMHVVWKFTLAYFIIIALPVIGTGIYINDSTNKAVIHQAGLLAKQNLMQKREIINQKIESIERTSISIAYNPQILKYVEDTFKNNYQGFEEYNYTFSPLFRSYIMQNKYIYETMLYLDNNSFPRGWNDIFQVSDIIGDEWYADLLADNSALKKWSSLHDSKTRKISGNIGRDKVLSLCQKLISFNDKSCIGLLEIEISEKVLFDNLVGSSNGEYFIVFDQEGKIVSHNTYNFLPQKYQTELIPTISKDEIEGVYTLKNEKLLIYSIPLVNIGCRLVGIIPLESFIKSDGNYTLIVACVIIAALIIFGVIIYLVTKRLTRRLKLLVKGLKSVRDENINIKMPVDTHDEFGELAESFNHMTERIHSLIERVYKAQITEKESELKALEAQINPHFLYNTLSTISWMARKAKAGNIDHLSLQLSQFYRLVLSKGKSVITVEDEINLLKSYVEIEKIRFENMLDVKYDLDEKALSYTMIKIILQPIAENTINHGILPKECRGTMIVKLRQDEENLYFTIIDDGIGMSRSTLESIKNRQIVKNRESGYAIHNIMERLKSVYGEKTDIIIASRPGIGCAVRIVIPKSPMFPNF